MLTLSNKLLFAIEAVVDIAYHAGGQPVQSRDITRRQQIPRRYLEQTLQQLVHANILTGIRGPKGGYVLSRERRRIFVGDIVRAISKMNNSKTQDLETDESIEKEKGSELSKNIIGPFWLEVQNNMILELDRVSIAQLCDKAYDIGILSEGRQSIDFTI